MLSEIYKEAMKIGFMFSEAGYLKDERTDEWYSCYACAEFAKKLIDSSAENKLSIEDAFQRFAEVFVHTTSNSDASHDWDDYCKGFLAGEIIGNVTDDNLAKAEKAEELWKDTFYGYYQECLEEASYYKA